MMFCARRKNKMSNLYDQNPIPYRKDLIKRLQHEAQQQKEMNMGETDHVSSMLYERCSKTIEEAIAEINRMQDTIDKIEKKTK
jgi:hypothetical protein